jgi:hypothetical protein
MANVIYNSIRRDIHNGNIDLDSDTIKVMLVACASKPGQDAHDKRDDLAWANLTITAKSEALHKSSAESETY